MKETLLAYSINNVLIFRMEISITESRFQTDKDILITYAKSWQKSDNQGAQVKKTKHAVLSEK